MPHELPVFNLAHHHTPAEVARPTSTDDVARAVVHAAARGQRVHPIGTGHGLLHPIAGGVALLTEGLARVTVDPTTSTARIGAGTSWGAVVEAAAPHGLTPLAGSAPGVGAIGFLLGGGLSPLGRTFGWASDYLLSAEVVTGTGDVFTASPAEHPDLFWAIRGGKRVPGIVTSVDVKLLELTTVYGGGLFFDGADADAVLSEWATWSAGLPEQVNTSLALLQLPDLDAVPAPLRGRFVVHVRVAIPTRNAADLALAASWVDPIRKAASPILDTVSELGVNALGSIHADPEEPMPVLEAGALLSDFNPQAARALLEAAGPQARAPLAVAEVRRLGGRLAHPPAEPDAVSGRDAEYGLFLISAPVPELFDGPVQAAVGATARAMAPWASGSFQPNFIGALNQPTAWQAAWSIDVQTRLAAVAAAYDPAAVISH